MTRNHDFEKQFHLQKEDYIKHLDFFTWYRHYHLIKGILDSDRRAVLEIGTGDGVLRNILEPQVDSYVVLDINSNLNPDIVGDLRVRNVELLNRFDSVVAAEVMEHLPFADFRSCAANLRAYLKSGGKAFLTLPNRKSSFLFVTPRQALHVYRAPNGLLSLSEFYHRFVKRKIWIDPNHCWEIGDGQVTRQAVESVFLEVGFVIEKLEELLYADYWVLAAGGAEPDIRCHDARDI